MAMADDLRRLSEEVGRFREENARFMGRIEQKVDGVKETVDSREDYAAKYRTETRDRIEDLRGDVAKLAASVARMQPVVASLTNLRAKASGAVVVLATIGAILGWLATTFADDLRALIARLFH